MQNLHPIQVSPMSPLCKVVATNLPKDADVIAPPVNSSVPRVTDFHLKNDNPLPSPAALCFSTAVPKELRNPSSTIIFIIVATIVGF